MSLTNPGGKIWHRLMNLSARVRWMGGICLAAIVVSSVIIVQRSMSAASQAARPQSSSRHSTALRASLQTNTNRLIKETSPYLLQHAHNPVDWYPWGKEALEKAKREDKPIFLSIGYSTCYWCHVMERESFENEGTAALMNEHFVCIKIDREERPDLDEIYMTAVQVTTGRGGWPMSVFLTPDLKPFFAGTYFPRDQFERILREIARLWRDDRARVESVAQRIANAVKAQVSMNAPASSVLDEAQLKAAVKSFEQEFDSAHGGFGGAPKFPPHQALAFLLNRYRQTKDESILRMVTVTLDQMARGGDYDQMGGGFHRYSTDARWLVPHFEKMLYDNAQLAPIYAEAYALTKNPYYRRIAEEVYAFVLREMTSPEGGFYSALDAESYVQQGGHEKEEGAYYVWIPEQVKAVLGDKDGDLFCKVYDITPSGNFEGKNIPNLLRRSVEEWAKELETTPDALWARLDMMRNKLLKAREQRPYPHLDDKLLTSWNALMMSSFARGYQLLKNERYLKAAETAARFVLSKLREKDGRLLRTYRAGKAKYNGYLDDYAFLTVALLDLHDATGKQEWLVVATSVADKMIELFWDKENGGFFFTSSDHPEQLLARSKSAFDGAEPSGNSMAALALLRLGRLTGRSEFTEKAKGTLETFGGFLTRAPRGFGMMLLTLDTFLTERKKPLLVKASTASAQSADIVRAEVEPAQITLKAGQPSALKVRVRIKEGWHINSHRPTLDYLVPTKLDLSSSLSVRLKQVQYPRGKRIKLGFAQEELDVYEGGVTLTAIIEVAEGKPISSGTLQLMLSYQACDDKQCLRPSSLTLSVPAKVAPAH